MFNKHCLLLYKIYYCYLLYNKVLCQDSTVNNYFCYILHIKYYTAIKRNKTALYMLLYGDRPDMLTGKMKLTPFMFVKRERR